MPTAIKHFCEYVIMKPCASKIKVGEEIGKSKVVDDNGNMQFFVTTERIECSFVTIYVYVSRIKVEEH